MRMEGMDSVAVEQDASIAQIQAQQLGQQAAINVSLPEVSFVGSINGLTGILTINAGTNISVTSDGVSNITVSVTGLATAATAKSNIAAVPPTIANDESEDYDYFSLWINTAVPDVYMCLNPATLAAVWVKLN